MRQRTAGRAGSVTSIGSGGAAATGAAAAGAGGAAAVGRDARAIVFNGQVTIVAAADIGRPEDALIEPYRSLPENVTTAPSQLLRSDYRVVGFRGRAEQLESLTAWAKDGSTQRLALLTGPGGSGKTRLAAELCTRVQADGWQVGFLRHRPAPASVAALVSAREPLTIVIDEVETRQDELLDLVETIAAWRSGRSRILLVAREAGGWWTTLPTRLHSVEAEPLLASATVYGLDAAEPTAEGRREAFAEAARRFAAVLGVEGPLPEPPELADRRFELPLWIAMVALSAVDALRESSTERHADPASLVQDALLRERRHWQGTAREMGLELDVPVLGRAVCVAMLSVAASEDAADALLRAVPDLSSEGDTRTRRHAARWLRSLYPGEEADWFRPLTPDLLGDAHLDGILAEDPRLPERVYATARPANASRLLTVLTRAAREHPSARSALEGLLEGRTDELLEPALAVAQETGDPIGIVLADILARDPQPSRVALVVDHLPGETVALRELAVVAYTATLEAYRALAADDPGAYEFGLATTLDQLALSLAAVGRPDEALAADEEAVEILRRLAAARPEACTPALARSLANLANRLAALGRREEALAAAEEATVVFRRLADADAEAFRPDLAGALNDLSNQMAALEQDEPALAAIEEAVAVGRQLAERNPDLYGSGLAGSLSNMAFRLVSLDRAEAALAPAQEAVEAYRELAAARPDAFGPDLAGSLDNLATSLARAGRPEAALAASREAVARYRQLAATRPIAFRPDVARSMNNLSNHLAELGRADEALDAIDQAVQIRRELVASLRAAHLPDLAGSLDNLGLRLAECGRLEDALEASRESVAGYRELASGNPDVFGLDLGLALLTLRSHLLALGRTAEAQVVLDETRAMAADESDAAE